MLSPSEWLLNQVLEFYKEFDHLNTIVQITNLTYRVGEDPDTNRRLSVRIVNWFVSNYAKQNMTTYTLYRPRGDGLTPVPDTFIVWNRFCAAKDGYVSKDLFDPYCRKGRISVQCTDGTLLNTTIGQLNFFKWAIQNKVIDYISEHFDDIVKDMGTRITVKLRPFDTDNKNRTRKKREELSTSACKSIKHISLLADTELDEDMQMQIVHTDPNI